MGPLPPLLAKHFHAPQHVGDPHGADGVGRAANPACGDRLELGVWVAGGRIERVRFRARACSATLAAASLASEHLVGRTLEAAESLDLALLLEQAGGLPPGKAHARAVVERAVSGALGAVRARYP